MISRITGVPAEGDDEERFSDLAQKLIRAFFPFASEEAVETGEKAFGAVAPWVREMVGERRRAPREDLLTDLVQARDRDDSLTDDEIILLVTGLLGAGSETTALGGRPHYCLGANLARQEMGSMLDAFLDIAPPGSKLREDLQQRQNMGLFERPLDFPVEIAKG